MHFFRVWISQKKEEALIIVIDTNKLSLFEADVTTLIVKVFLLGKLGLCLNSCF